MVSVLIVDDSPIDRKIASDVLRNSMNCNLQEANDGEAALAMLASELPSVVVTDLQMPGIDGLGLVEQIRKHYPPLPVILMTARGSEAIASKALFAGAASYVPKNQLVTSLAASVRQVINAADQEQSHSRMMHHLGYLDAVFDLQNDPTLIQPLIQLIQESLRCLPLGNASERLRVGIAVDAAIRNVMLYSNLELFDNPEEKPEEALVAERFWEPPYCNRELEVFIRINPEEAVFSIRGEGPKFDPSIVTSTFDCEDERVRNSHLMKSFMDDVKYDADSGQITLTRSSHLASPDLPE